MRETATKDVIAEHFSKQAQACAELGSPFTAALLRDLPARLPPRTAFFRRIAQWPGDARADALALRAAGALHALARSGRDAEMAAAWPPAGATDDPAGVAAGAVARHDAWLETWLDRAPQTNETARSAVLLGGALVAARETGLEMEILEIGASAGLNLAFDRYRHDLGEGRSWGDPASPVLIRSAWRGAAPPLDAPLRVAARAGVDLEPLDARDAGARERLLAYIWPDQAERLARAEAALTMAAAAPWRVARGDAAQWLEERLAAPQAAGRLRLVMHSIMWMYMPKETQERAAAAIKAAGAAADERRPFGWLRMETDAAPDSAAVRLALWPGGEDRLLARADFHGRWAAWTGPGDAKAAGAQ